MNLNRNLKTGLDMLKNKNALQHCIKSIGRLVVGKLQSNLETRQIVNLVLMEEYKNKMQRLPNI